MAQLKYSAAMTNGRWDELKSNIVLYFLFQGGSKTALKHAEEDWRLSLNRRERQGPGSRELRLQPSSLAIQCLTPRVKALTSYYKCEI